MNQSNGKPTSDAVDCSEAMEAKIADRARELIKLWKCVGKSVSGFVHIDRLGLVRIRIDAMADDADESSVQKTHPSNQDIPRKVCACGSEMEYYDGN